MQYWPILCKTVQYLRVLCAGVDLKAAITLDTGLGCILERRRSILCFGKEKQHSVFRKTEKVFCILESKSILYSGKEKKYVLEKRSSFLYSFNEKKSSIFCKREEVLSILQKRRGDLERILKYFAMSANPFLFFVPHLPPLQKKSIYLLRPDRALLHIDLNPRVLNNFVLPQNIPHKV